MALIPIEDLSVIMVHGANIRLSTMDISILSQNKVAIVTLDEKYLPTAIVLPYEGNARQSMLMHAQVNTSEEKYRKIWVNIIKQKVIKVERPSKNGVSFNLIIGMILKILHQKHLLTCLKRNLTKYDMMK